MAPWLIDSCGSRGAVTYRSLPRNRKVTSSNLRPLDFTANVYQPQRHELIIWILIWIVQLLPWLLRTNFFIKTPMLPVLGRCQIDTLKTFLGTVCDLFFSFISSLLGSLGDGENPLQSLYFHSFCFCRWLHFLWTYFFRQSWRYRQRVSFLHLLASCIVAPFIVISYFCGD